jgi:hypothetical protein
MDAMNEVPPKEASAEDLARAREALRGPPDDDPDITMEICPICDGRGIVSPAYAARFVRDRDPLATPVEALREGVK